MPLFRVGQLVQVWIVGHVWHRTKVQIKEIVPGKSQSFYMVETANKQRLTFDEKELIAIDEIRQNQAAPSITPESFVETEHKLAIDC